MIRKALKILLWFVLGLVFLIVAFFGTCGLLNLRTPAATDIAKSPQLISPPAPLKAPVTLKVVTFNIWDLFPVSTHRPERMAVIGEVLTELGPDIVGFQEAFIEKDRQILLEAIEAAGLIHHHYFRSGLVGSGLLVASRYPFEEVHFRRYSNGGKPHRIDHGDWWAGKGVCLARIRLPNDAGYVDFFNTHAHAGYGHRPYDAVRLSNMKDLAAYVNEAATGVSPAFFVGDINTDASEEAYKTLMARLEPERLMTVESRIDHIFAVPNPLYLFETIDTQPIRKETAIGAESVPLSDHTGYMSTIRITPAR